MGSGEAGEKTAGPTDPDTAFDQDDIASEIHGRNSLQGADQDRVPNERRAVPDVKRETSGVLESLKERNPRE
jgi:hypothetical protein